MQFQPGSQPVICNQCLDLGSPTVDLEGPWSDEICMHFRPRCHQNIAKSQLSMLGIVLLHPLADLTSRHTCANHFLQMRMPEMLLNGSLQSIHTFRLNCSQMAPSCKMRWHFICESNQRVRNSLLANEGNATK